MKLYMFFMLKFEYESPLTQHHQKNLRRGLQLSMKNTLILRYQGKHVPLGTMSNVSIVKEVMDPIGSIFPININHSNLGGSDTCFLR